MKILLAFVAVVVAIACPRPCAAQWPFPADLVAGSQFEHGCFDPCACPISIRSPVEGTMALVMDDVIDPKNPFVNYWIHDVRWQVTDGGPGVQVRGSGGYRQHFFTHEQQLVMDLSLNDGEVQRYDSGLVPGSGVEGVIDIDISLHGEFCLDSVFRVRARFRTTGVPGGTASISPRAYPNPFGATTEIAFTTSTAGPVDVRLFDPAGRQVAVLATGWRAAGPVALRWDGRRADGRPAPAGVYLAHVRADGRTAVLRLARVP